MLAIRTILCPTDGSACAASARQYAEGVARRFGATLHVLHVVVDPKAPMTDFEFGLSEAELADELREPLPCAPTHGAYTVEVERRSASPAHEILAYAREIDADAIVMGTHGRTGFQRFLVGSVAERVVRHARCPVLTVNASDVPCQVPIHRLLVPFDFSTHALQAVRYAREIAAAYGTDVLVLHVVPPPEVMIPALYGFNAALMPPEAVQEHLEETLRSAMEAAPGPAVPMTFHVVTGAPALAIVDFAQTHHIDGIFMASHGRTGLARLSLGSVAEQVMRHAPCPVFTLKSFGKPLIREAVLEAAATA